MEKEEKRNIGLAAAGVGISRLGTSLYSFAIGLYVLKVTGSGQSFALTLILGVLPRVVLGPFIGTLTDRSNKKLLIVGADLFSALMMGIMFFIARADNLTLPLIYLTTLLLSLSETFLGTAFEAAQQDMVSIDSLTRFSSLRQSVKSFVNLVSPLLAGFVYALIPLWFFLALNGVSFFLSALSETFIDFHLNGNDEKREQGESFMVELRQGFVYFKNHRLIIAIALCAMGLNFFLSSLNVMLPFGLVTYMNIPENIYGFVLSAASGGALLGAIAAGKLKIRLTRRYFLLCLAAMGGLLILIGGAFWIGKGLPPVAAAAPVALFAGMVSLVALMINIPLGVFFQVYVDKAYLGRVGSLVGAICEIVMPLAFILYGFLTGFLSPSIILGGSGLLVLFLVLLLTIMPVFGEIDRVSYIKTSSENNKELA